MSNNAEKHFRNWEKDGILLITSMPTEEEVIAMATVLWDNDNTLHPWQVDTLNTIEEKQTEVEKRIDFVRPIPRLVFESELFRKAIIECIIGGAQAVEKVSDSDLYKAMRGKYSPLLAKGLAPASSNGFFLDRDTVKHRTWKERRKKFSLLQPNPIGELVLRDRLEKIMAALRTDNFEDFAFDWLCEMKGSEPEILYGGGILHETAFRRIVSLGRNEMRVIRPGSRNFPFVDFMLSRTKWFNAKSVHPLAETVYLNEKGALLFLNRMERYIFEAYSPDSICKILGNDPPVLVVVTNGNVESRLRKKVALSLFDVSVQIEVMNLADGSSAQLLNRIDGTDERLQEYEECMGMRFR